MGWHGAVVEINMKEVRLLLIATFICSLATAQTTDVWTYYKSKYVDQPAVIIDRSQTLNLVVSGDSIKAYADVKEEMLHLKDQADAFSDRKVYGSHFNRISNLKAKTLVWDRGRYKEMAVSNFNRASDPSDGVFFDDSYYYSFNFPALAAQNRTQLEYREEIKDVRFISGYVFSSYLPQVKTTFTINVPKGVEIGFRVFNDPDGLLQFSKVEKAGQSIFQWSAENLPALKFEANGPEARYYAPHVVCFIKSYQTRKGKSVRLLSNLDDLYSWYYSFIKDLHKSPSPELETVVEKIKSASSSELEIVKNTFYWVQDHIKYIAFEQGMRGFVPHSASYVCEKRYGDCKDMASIIVGMLQVAGIKSFCTWIGSRDLPYRYTEIPSPMVDNHMIATYISPDGQYYFLDATSNYTPFGYPSSMIQGKEALIAIDSQRYEIREVPVIEPGKSLIIDSVIIKIDNNQLIGTGESKLTGYQKIFSAYELDRSGQEDIKNSLVKILYKGSNKFYLDQYEVKNLHDRDNATRIKYDFRIADYFQKTGDEIFINLNLEKSLYNDLINTSTRKTPLEAKIQNTSVEIVELTIPTGYEVDYLPENIRYEGKHLSFEMTYTHKPGTVILNRRLELKYIYLTTPEFDTWNDSVKKLSAAYKESVILKHK